MGIRTAYQARYGCGQGPLTGIDNLGSAERDQDGVIFMNTRAIGASRLVVACQDNRDARGQTGGGGRGGRDACAAAEFGQGGQMRAAESADIQSFLPPAIALQGIQPAHGGQVLIDHRLPGPFRHKPGWQPDQPVVWGYEGSLRLMLEIGQVRDGQYR